MRFDWGEGSGLLRVLLGRREGDFRSVGVACDHARVMRYAARAMERNIVLMVMLDLKWVLFVGAVHSYGCEF